MGKIDIELETLKRKKLLELQRKALSAQEKMREPVKPQLNPWDLVKTNLVSRGLEVLEAARMQYPTQIELLVKQLSMLIDQGRIVTPVTGEDLYSLFHYLGLPIRLETKITVMEHGKTKTLAEKLTET